MGASLTGTTLIKSLLLGSAAGIVAVTFAQAADLPTRKAAPVEYVKVCNVGGITGWTLPGSDTCLKFSGFVTAQFAGGNLNTQYNWAGSPIYSTITGVTLPAAISAPRHQGSWLRRATPSRTRPSTGKRPAGRRA